MDSIREDLESLTGMLIRGSITPLVYNLLKDSPYKEDILQYKDLISKERRDSIDVQKQDKSSNTIEEADNRTSFERFLAEFGKPVSL